MRASEAARLLQKMMGEMKQMREEIADLRKLQRRWEATEKRSRMTLAWCCIQIRKKKAQDKALVLIG